MLYDHSDFFLAVRHTRLLNELFSQQKVTMVTRTMLFFSHRRMIEFGYKLLGDGIRLEAIVMYIFSGLHSRLNAVTDTEMVPCV